MFKQKELPSLQLTQQRNHNRNENVNREQTHWEKVISHDEYSGKSLPNTTEVSTGRLSVVYYIMKFILYGVFSSF